MDEIKDKSVDNMNSTVLAYLGDAIFELFVRERVLKDFGVHVDILNREVVKFVSAKGQAYAIKTLFLDKLTKEEKDFVRRARNRKVTTKAKNVDVMTYKWATAYEALLGYLYLSKQENRLEEVMSLAMEVINEQGR